MRFGICISRLHAPAAREAGWDYVEENVQTALKGLEKDWTAPGAAVLPVPAANSLVPGSVPIVGSNVNLDAVKAYMTNVLERAPRAGITTLVFGSAAARNVPEGFDRARAVEQIAEFLRLIAPIAQRNGVMIVIEPLNKGECNIINTVAEAMIYVKRINHPNVRCLVDSYHFWLENEPLSNLEAAMPWIEHVHVADRDGRVAPGESGTSDYKPFFKVLKQGGYDKLCSVECPGVDLARLGNDVLKRLKDDWESA